MLTARLGGALPEARGPATRSGKGAELMPRSSSIITMPLLCAPAEPAAAEGGPLPGSLVCRPRCLP